MVREGVLVPPPSKRSRLDDVVDGVEEQDYEALAQDHSQWASTLEHAYVYSITPLFSCNRPGRVHDT
jgi:hypothetical protein